MLEAASAPRPREVPRAVWRTAAEQVRVELEERLKDRCSIPNPPPFANSSVDGEYPRARTFEFVDGLRVVYSEENSAFRVYSKTHDHHGVFLQGPPVSSGLRDGTTRPYATLIQQEEDWSARVNAVAREMNK